MIIRDVENQVVAALRRGPAVVLTGPRQVGKTSLAFKVAEHLSAEYLDLESPLDLKKVEDFSTYFAANREKLIILDEIQRRPELFSEIRGIIDQERRIGNRKGLFLFLGSASLDLLKQSSESLAGRISMIELFPVNVLENNRSFPGTINRLWYRGGFPDSLIAEDDSASYIWRYDFIRTYIERDIPLFGPKLPAMTVLRFWTMLANIQGSTLNASQFSKVLEVSQPTVKRYLDVLTDMLLIRQLPPWSGNLNKRLVRSPKIYIRDSGITHALLHIRSFNDLLGHPVLGGSWEGFVIENILSVLPPGVGTYFYRSQAGAEIDLILDFGLHERWAIEIKRNSVPSLTKGFHMASEDIEATRKYVVYGGKDTFAMAQNTTAIPVLELLKLVAERNSI